MSEAKKLDDEPKEPSMTPEEGNKTSEALPKPKRSWERIFRNWRYKPTPRPPQLRPFQLLKKILGKSFKYVSYVSLALLTISIAAYNAARLIYSDDKIADLIEALVAEQTGGRLELGSLSFSLLSGLSLKDVTFYSDIPSRDHSGPTLPLLGIDKVEVAYSLPKILTGRIHISAIKMVHPQLNIIQSDGTFNFQKILDYRAEKFPPAGEKPPEDASQNDSTSSTQDIASIKSLLFFMPIEIMIHDIGVKEFGLRFDAFEKETLIKQVELSGASLDLGAYWFKTKSNFWVSLISSFERPLKLKINQKEDSTPKSQSPPLKKVLELESAHIMRIEIENFSKINIDLASRFPKFDLVKAQYENATMFTKGRIKASDDFSKISIEEFDNQILDALNYRLKSDITLNSGTFEKFILQSEQNLSLNLSKISELIQPFNLGLLLEGKIRIEKLTAQGEIDLNKMKNIEKMEGLPALSGLILLENIRAAIDNSGLKMEPLSGRLALTSSPKATQDGLQTDVSFDLSLPRMSYSQDLPDLGPIEAQVKNLSMKLITRLVLPDATVPILNLDLESENISAKGAIVAPLDTPFVLNINAEGDKNLTDISLSQNLQLGSLAEIAINGNCQESCSKFRASLLARLDSLEKIHSIILPMKGKLVPDLYMPSQLEGSLDLQFNTRGQIPNPLQNKPDDILKSGDIRFNLQSTLSKFSTKLPFMSLNIRTFDNRILANGDLKEQNFELAQKFSSVSFVKSSDDSSSPPSPEIKANLAKYSFDLQIKNEFSGPIDISKPLDNMSTQVLTWFVLGKLEAPSVLPRVLNDLSFETDVFQNRLRDFSIDNIALRSPDYGTSLKITAKAQLNEELKPLGFRASVFNQVSHNGNENLPGGIKTNGKLETKIELSSSNMEHYNLDGHIGFEKFSFYLLKPKTESEKLISIEDINGEMPLKQNIKLPKLDDIIAFFSKPDNLTSKQQPIESQPKDQGADDIVPNIAKSKDDESKDPFMDLVKSMESYIDRTKDKLKDNTNAMSLVDYSTLRPFFPNKKPISIRRIDAANLELSNLEFDIELKQNWFALNQYIISFLGGKIQGTFLLAFDATLPQIEKIASDAKKIPKSLRTSLHLTRLDTRKLLERFPNLKGKGDSLIPVFSNPYLDGTVHLSYDLLTNELGGGIEITSIGKEQLKMMLYYVDPFEQNPTISDIRGALDLGEVRQVSIPLKNGEIGMDVDVRVLGAPIPTPKLTRFPISQIIGNLINQGASKEEESKDSGKNSNSALKTDRRLEKTWEDISLYVAPT